MAFNKRLLQIQLDAIHKKPENELKPAEYKQIIIAAKEKMALDRAIDVVEAPKSPEQRRVEYKPIKIKNSRCRCTIL